jgi:anti-sigma factor RsiW
MAANPACKTFQPQLSPFIDGELAPAERTAVERHLAACQACAGRVADLRAESGLIRIGLEMASDDVDFSKFSQNVMARITPERPPLWERVKLSVSELFLYQRGQLVTGMVAAAVVALVAVPLLTRESYPLGYARERMELTAVSTDSEAHVSPVVMYTDKGDAIIWLVDHEDHGQQVVPGNPSGPSGPNGQGSDPGDDEDVTGKRKQSGEGGKVLDQQRPSGGEL